MVRKFRKSNIRNLKMQPYVRRERGTRHGTNGMLPSPMYVPLYVTPSRPDWTGR